LIEDLSSSCPDNSVVEENLMNECGGTHDAARGIPAAVCYMDYLCENHDQETVNDHKDCIDGVCPLLKRVPTRNCEEYWEERNAAIDAAMTNEPDLEEGEKVTVTVDQEIIELTRQPTSSNSSSSSGSGMGAGHILLILMCISEGREPPLPTVPNLR